MNLIEATAVALANPTSPDHVAAVCVTVTFGAVLAAALAMLAYGACRDKRTAAWKASERRRRAYLMRTDGTFYKHRAMARDTRGN